MTDCFVYRQRKRTLHRTMSSVMEELCVVFFTAEKTVVGFELCVLILLYCIKRIVLEYYCIGILRGQDAGQKSIETTAKFVQKEAVVESPARVDVDKRWSGCSSVRGKKDLWKFFKIQNQRLLARKLHEKKLRKTLSTYDQEKKRD